MATQHDLSEVLAFLDEGHEYPGVKSKRHPDGKTYRVAAPDAKMGLYFTTLAEMGNVVAAGGELTAQDMASLTLGDEEESNFYRQVLGSAFDDMVDDGVSWPAVQAIGRHAFLTFAMSQEIADEELQAALGKARSRPAKTAARPRGAARKPAGSSSRKASTGTPARTRNQASTRSSTSADEREEPKAV